MSGSGKSSLVFGTIAAESQRLINETYSADRSMSETAPRPSHRGHMPPVMVKLRRSFTVFPPRSSVTAPAPLIEAMLKENAVGPPM